MLNKIPTEEDPVTVEDLFFEVAKLRQEFEKKMEVIEFLLDLLLMDPKLNMKKN